LEKRWHVDELLPVRRNIKWDKRKNRYVWDGTCEHPERLNIDNQMPSCNINKHSMGLEDFRYFIFNLVKNLNKYSTQFKIAKRFGLVNETGNDVVFYFEKCGRID
jgi:hypothetical protein